MAEEQFTFQAEVSKLLDIVAHSLYSHKEIFLRELISNAADACDRLRYQALTNPDLLGASGGFKITIALDRKARTLTVADNGIGMTRGELAENLGTIARSGTQAFIEQLSEGGNEGAGSDMALIGQFGVGFYSAFMVADQVSVVSRKAGEDQAWQWTSDGKGEFTVAEAQRETRGATVTVHLSKSEKEFLDPVRVRTVVKKYSDHIGVPIVLRGDGSDETLNEGSALWTRPAKEISDDQYKEFYRHVGHIFDEPWKILHNRVEGVLAYTNLLFIPSTPPFDLFDPERKSQVKLYVKRVFITDDCETLLPAYLRFLRGVVDSEDLSLNISREMLQKDPKLAKIRSGLVKRVLSELSKTATKKPEDYATFWDNFGAVLKEGIYEDHANRDKILALARFRTTAGEGSRSLEAYVEDMMEGQEAIYTISGDEPDALCQSPQLEGFKARGIEVLLLTDPIDEFWVSAVGSYKDKPFKSVTRGAAEDLEKIKSAPKDGEPKEPTEKEGSTGEIDTLVAALKLALGDVVKDVRVSERLTDSPVCLVAAEGDMDMHLERLLKQHRRSGHEVSTPRILEVNPKHALIRRLADRAQDGGDDATLKDAAFLLLDQARIVEGESVPDPVDFARRLAAFMEKGLGV